jgi:hypothetical protein
MKCHSDQETLLWRDPRDQLQRESSNRLTTCGVVMRVKLPSYFITIFRSLRYQFNMQIVALGRRQICVTISDCDLGAASFGLAFKAVKLFPFV